MCGRYASSKDPDALVEEFEVDETVIDAPLDPDYNVAPTKSVYAVLQRHAKDDDNGPAKRQLRVAKWGLVPSWAKDPKIGSRMINARVETLAEKPAFRRATVKRRCLIPADGYYEWYTPSEPQSLTKSGKPRKQPFFIQPADGSSLPMAGLYEWWLDKAKDRDDPDSWLLSVVIITTQATDALGHIHDRMPLVVPHGDWSAWLDPDNQDAHTADRLLVPATNQQLVAYPVSTAVNDVRNNGKQLTDALPLDDGADGEDGDRAEVRDTLL